MGVCQLSSLSRARQGLFHLRVQRSSTAAALPTGVSNGFGPLCLLWRLSRRHSAWRQVLGTFYVLAVVAASWVLGGPLAAIVGGLFVGFSPFARDSAGLVLSDIFVAALMVVVMPLLKPVSRSGARLAGALAGLATVARLTAGVSIVGLLAALPRRYYKPMLMFALPPLIGLALLQWALFGSPTDTGYNYWGFASHVISLGYVAGHSVVRGGPFIFPDRLNGALLNWICPCQPGGPQASLPNFTFYPLQLASVFWVFSPPFVPLLGLLYAWRRRSEPVARYALMVTGLSLIVFIPYLYQETKVHRRSDDGADSARQRVDCRVSHQSFLKRITRESRAGASGAPLS